MILPLFALFAAAQNPKSFEDLELAKIVTWHNVKHMRFEEKLTSTEENGDVHVIGVSVLIQGDKSRASLKIDDQPLLISLTNPPESWVVAPSQKKYFQQKIDTTKRPAFDAKEHLLKADPDTFNLTFDTDEPIRFGPAKKFVIRSFTTVREGGESLRKVEATITNKEGRSLVVTQWFLLDKWIVKRFTVARSGQSSKIAMKGVATTIDFEPNAKDSEFVLDRSTIAGFEKAGLPPKLGS